MKNTISILASIIIIASCKSENKLDPNNLDGKMFYRDGFNKSIIQFNGDSIFIVNFPPEVLDETGTISASRGTFKLDTQTKEIKCEIQKTVNISLNIGYVREYFKDCNQKLDFQLAENGSLSKKRYKSKINQNGQLESTEAGLITYNEQIPTTSLLLNYMWAMNLLASDNGGRRIKCEELKQYGH
jgi:hypothetical protein